jgi:hypothetical protein
MKRKCLRVLVLALVVMMVCSSAVMAKKKNPLAKWKSTVDMSGAKYTMKVSNISHPVIEGVAAGYRVRDSLWKKSNGQIALKYYPLHQLGGEVEVLNMLKTNTVQGMLCSSVAVTNLAPRMGIINLPFLINSFDKLDKYIASPLWQHFLDGMKHQGIMGADITGYDRIGIPVVNAVRPFERGMSVSHGKGVDLAAAMASALMESVERFCAVTTELPCVRDSYVLLKKKNNVVPAELLPLSKTMVSSSMS